MKNLLCSCIAFFMIFICTVNAQEFNGIRTVHFDTLSPYAKAHSSKAVASSGSDQNSTNRIDQTDAACGAPGNDNFASATNIPIGTTLTNQTTCGATLQANEAMDCDSGQGFNASVWYKFTATSTGPYFINIDGGTSACTYSANIWNTSTLPVYGNNCNDQSMQCQRDFNNAVFAPTFYSMEVTNVTIGTTYYIQILYINSGGLFGCGSTSTTNTQHFNIGVTTTQAVGSTLTNPPANNTCATAYPACYINKFNPTVGYVDSNCTQHATTPYPLQQNDVYTICYSFTTSAAADKQLAVQAILLSYCNPNVYWADWKLYNSGCSLMECGDIKDLTISGVGCSTAYTLCFTFEAACQIDTVTPYASWPSATPTPCSPLPIKLLSFNVDYQQISNSVDIYWSTATETNNKLFTLEKSVNMVDWATVCSIPGAGNSDKVLYYTSTDEMPYPGMSYYRLKQTDFDGNVTYSQALPINIPADCSAHIFPNPTKENMTLRYSTQSQDPVTIVITDISGKMVTSYSINEVQQGVNNFTVPTSSLSQGMYLMKVSNAQKTFFLKFVKE